MSGRSNVFLSWPEVEYRDVPGFPGYCVGDDGTVWSCWSRGCKPRLLDEWHRSKPTIHKSGYPYVTLNREYRFYVHQLVLLAFVGPCPPGKEVRHENGRPADCRVSNLLYGTHAENMQDAIRHGTSNASELGRKQRGVLNNKAKLNDELVRAVRRRLNAGEPGRHIAISLNVSESTVSLIKRGRIWTHVAS